MVSGVGFNTKDLTAEENQIFDEQFPKLVALFTKYSVNGDIQHKITDILMSKKEEFRFLASVAKAEIEPNPGAFEGMTPISGFGFTLIRPDFIVVAAQGRTFDRAVSGLTKDNWYGLYHNGAIGAAYATQSLYLRKEMLLGIAGHHELGNPVIEEIQWEIESRPKSIFNMVEHMRGTDLPMFEYPKVIPLRPAKTYRCQAKFAAVAANVAPMPIGIAFVSAEWMRTTTPTQPSTTAP